MNGLEFDKGMHGGSAGEKLSPFFCAFRCAG
jgi:hypothetical protein